MQATQECQAAQHLWLDVDRSLWRRRCSTAGRRRPGGRRAVLAVRGTTASRSIGICPRLHDAGTETFAESLSYLPAAADAGVGPQRYLNLLERPPEPAISR